MIVLFPVKDIGFHRHTRFDLEALLIIDIIGFTLHIDDIPFIFTLFVQNRIGGNIRDIAV